MSIGAEIRRLRMAEGWTVAYLAHQAGCSREHLSRVEAGLHKPSRPLVETIGEALQVSYDADNTVMFNGRTFSLD